MQRLVVHRSIILSFVLTLLSSRGSIAAQSVPLTPLRVAMSPVTYSEIPLRFAISQGLFQKAGLEIQLSMLSNGAAITAAVAGGSIDVGLGTISGTVTAFAKGLPITLIAPAVVYDAAAPPLSLLVLKGGGINRARDLVNKTIALSDLNDAIHPAIERWLSQNGVDASAAKSIKFVEMPQSLMLSAVEDGRADAVAIISPIKDQDLATGKVRVLAPALNAIARRFVWTAYFAQATWAENHRQEIATFLRVLDQAASFVDANHRRMPNEIATLTGQPVDVVQAMTWPATSPALYPQEVQPVINILAEHGYIDRAFTAQQLIFDLRGN